MIYNHKTGFCECAAGTTLFGDKCLNVEIYGPDAFSGNQQEEK